MDITLGELVKGTKVRFDSYRAGFFYYNIVLWRDSSAMPGSTVLHRYQFTVPAEDVGNATLLHEDKAITYMRWIRRALEDNTLTLTHSRGTK
jgi:hypothetical protein